MPSPDASGLIECNWSASYTIPNIPPTWTRGVYLAKLTVTAASQPAAVGKQSYILFVVRDNLPADYLFQLSVTTYQAYNNWGGKSLYQDQGVGLQASRVSFNRPYGDTNNPPSFYTNGAGHFLPGDPYPYPYNPYPPPYEYMGYEYNMLRWLEFKGYNVGYCTDVETHADATLAMLSMYKAFLSVGHDEYWSLEMQTNIKNARDQRGLHLAFFSGNSVYWHIRFEPSHLPPPNNLPNRVIVCYKYDSGAPQWPTLGYDPVYQPGQNPLPPDPSNLNCTYIWFVTPNWEDYRLTGESWVGAWPVDADIQIVIDASTPPWVYAGTGLVNGNTLPGLLGYEADGMCQNQIACLPSTPGPLIKLAESPFTAPVGAGGPPLCTSQHSCNSHMTTYTTPGSNAIVVYAGTIQWSWGLDNYGASSNVNCTGTQIPHCPRYSPEAEKITCNILEKFVPATPSRCPSLGPSYGLTASPSVAPAGSALQVAWTAPGGRPPVDWIGLYRVGDPHTNYLARQYTGGAATGVTTFILPSQAGLYEIRYFIENRYLLARRSNVVTVP